MSRNADQQTFVSICLRVCGKSDRHDKVAEPCKTCAYQNLWSITYDLRLITHFTRLEPFHRLCGRAGRRLLRLQHRRGAISGLHQRHRRHQHRPRPPQGGQSGAGAGRQNYARTGQLLSSRTADPPKPRPQRSDAGSSRHLLLCQFRR